MTQYLEILKKFKNRIPRCLLGFSLKESESTRSLKGHLTIKAFENGKLVHSYAHSNIIVNTASILISRLLKDPGEAGSGISYLAVGTGDRRPVSEGGWNLQDPPAPTTSANFLVGESFRKGIGINDTSFIDPETGDPTSTATNIVDYSITFNEAEAVGPIVEMGLFGGSGANSNSNTGTMMNWRTFPVINKTNSMTLTVIFRITA
jgi:hypothetical protein